ncbi:MAG TPA: hypothetical protein ENN56_04475 [Firmicutes bacterium]|nr:hypothetical protein [Bacillota bacterium]
MYVELNSGDLSAAVVDNAAHHELSGHRAGYNGLAWLKSVHRHENLFVPLYAGLNLELYFDGTDTERKRLFEPRSAPMSIRQVDDTTAILYQEPTPHFRVESWTTFQLIAPHSIDFHFRAIPRARTFNGPMGVFWASYIEQPEDLALTFPVIDEHGERWVRHLSPQHGVESTHRFPHDTIDLPASGMHEQYMYASLSKWRLARPYYFGVSNGMMYLFMADTQHPSDDTIVRFTQSPSGGGPRCPAWDFQMIVPEYEIDTPYGISARVVYKPFTSYRDIEDEFAQWQAHRFGTRP